MVQLRQLMLDDMDAAAFVHRTAFDERLPWLAGLHTPKEDRSFYRKFVFPRSSVWGAEAESRLVGIVAFRTGWLDQLYILPGFHRRGIGRALLNHAKADSAALRLWAFQRNAGARAFYEANGFAVIEETDGGDNEEREPDVLYEWIRPHAR